MLRPVNRVEAECCISASRWLCPAVWFLLGGAATEVVSGFRDAPWPVNFQLSSQCQRQYVCLLSCSQEHSLMSFFCFVRKASAGQVVQVSLASLPAAPAHLPKIALPMCRVLLDGGLYSGRDADLTGSGAVLGPGCRCVRADGQLSAETSLVTAVYTR